MARKTREITITAEGRDKGKKFLVVEMPVIKFDEWTAEAVMILANNCRYDKDRVNLVEMADAMARGFSGNIQMVTEFAIMGIQSLARAKFGSIKHLYAQLLECCRYIGTVEEPIPFDKDKLEERGVQLTPDFVESIVGELSTLITLRKEALDLHTNFCTALRLLFTQMTEEEPQAQS